MRTSVSAGHQRTRDRRRLSAGALLVALALAGAGVLALSACGSPSAPAASASASASPIASAPASASPTPISPTPATQGFQRDPMMQTAGIIGGVSWVSSVEYYRIMNRMVRDEFGPNYSSALLLYSIPFGEFAAQEKLAAEGDWVPLRATMADAARRLRAGGADFIIIASNTMNSTADLVEKASGLPVLHIQDPVGEAVTRKGLTKVALLGTRYTMEEPFYRDRLKSRHGITVVTPNRAERNYINAAIFDRLCADVYTDRDRERFVRIIERLVEEEGAEGVILGCTEIPLLVHQKDVSVPAFDSTRLHAAAAVRYQLGEETIDP